MSPSSSGSWSGGQRADIIDLDRYMRGGIRPSRPLTDDGSNHDSTEQLVVDAGGARVYASGDARAKQYSLDSGVSDGSYARRIHRRPRNDKFSNQGSHIRAYSHESPRTNKRYDSSDSLKAFRTVCERVLIDQQRQISRVAELCERLTERVEKEPEKTVEQTEKPKKIEKNLKRPKSKRSDKSSQERPKRMDHNRKRLEEVDSVETTEISSSSRSTQDLRGDKSRTQECKTYKIIMNKLDHLNRLFVSGPARPRVQTPSTDTVSVCDKIVSTDTPRTVDKIMMPSVHVTAGKPQTVPNSAKVIQAYRVDIAPDVPSARRTNVITESVIKDETSNGASKDSVADPTCGFDLNDPIHLYSQAKRLQALAATTHAEPAASVGDSEPHDSQQGDKPVTSQSSERSPSLCAVCRAYIRYIRRCLAATLLARTER